MYSYDGSSHRWRPKLLIVEFDCDTHLLLRSRCFLAIILLTACFHYLGEFESWKPQQITTIGTHQRNNFGQTRIRGWGSQVLSYCNVKAQPAGQLLSNNIVNFYCQIYVNSNHLSVFLRLAHEIRRCRGSCTMLTPHCWPFSTVQCWQGPQRPSCSLTVCQEPRGLCGLKIRLRIKLPKPSEWLIIRIDSLSEGYPIGLGNRNAKKSSWTIN